eukprot:2432465-Rhodomonas_salina.1
MAVQRYLAARCINMDGIPPNAPVPSSTTAAAAQGGSVENLLNWLGNDGVQLTPADVQAHLDAAKVLVEGENVVMAFKAGRDSCVLTDRRLLSIDVQGFSGKRVAYISIPYASMRAYAVESAGSFDRDAELKIFTRIYWELATFSQDFRKGKADILAIQTFLSCMILRDGKASLPPGADLPSSSPGA